MSEVETRLREVFAKRRLTVHQVARRLGVHQQTILRWIRKGKLPAIASPSDSKFGHRYRILESDVREFEREREVKPNPSTKRPLDASGDGSLIDLHPHELLRANPSRKT